MTVAFKIQVLPQQYPPERGIYPMSPRQTAIFSENNVDSKTPIVIFHAFRDEAEKVWNLLRESGCPPFVLAAIRIEDWEETLSPWPAKKVFKGSSDFGAGADQYLRELSGEIIPEIRKSAGCVEGPCFIAGYSFAGLFALYSLYRSDAFERAASVSGSLWFPGFSDFAASHEMQRKPERLYLSIGDKEGHSRNEVLRSVVEKTEFLSNVYQQRGIRCTFELNSGNHFQEPEMRLAKGIRWLLQ